MIRTKTALFLTASLLVPCIIAESCPAQSKQPSIFVANNGNSEGSVTSFLVNADGTLTLVQKVVTPGSTNAQCVDISPNGRWLCTGHGTISGTVEQLTFFEVHADATMSVVLETTTPDSPVDVVWIDDEHIVVTNTSSSPDQVIVYHFNAPPATPSINQVWFSELGTSTFDIVIDRAHDLLYPRASTSAVQPQRINANRSLTAIPPVVPTGVFFLGPGISRDGTRLYYGGGISSSGGLSSRWIGGFSIDTTTGTLTPMPGSPYLSPPFDGTAGPSPKEVDVSDDGQFAFVNHGGTGHIKGFAIDFKSGALTDIPNSFFDVGGQGDSGNMATMGDHLFVTRRYAGTGGNPPAGAISLTINFDGTLTQAGTTYPTQGSLPWDIAVWPGPAIDCPADVDNTGSVDSDDLTAVILAWGPCAPPCAADIDGNGSVDSDDLTAVILAWGACP